MPRLLALLVGILAFAQAHPCQAEWTKDITCPAGTVYRDLRPYAGREEFCERLLPGSLRVKDGPYRFWFSEGYPGGRGNYKNGRQVGLWKKCSSSGHCRHVEYELTYPSEKERPGFRPEIPVTYQHGKYVFDFASCWSTWVTKRADEDLNLNVGGSGNRCDVAYIPQHVMDHGGEGDYFCEVPFSVGKRELDSLDLMHELPKLGLPQFCHVINRKTGTLMLVDKGFMDVATTDDVQCAALGRDNEGHEILTFTLNQYVAELATELAAKRGPLIARLCISGDHTTSLAKGAAGHTRFSFQLSDVAAEAGKQKHCIAQAIELKASCP